MFWMLFSIGYDCDTTGPSGCASAHGPSGVSATATPIANLSLVVAAAWITGA